MTFPIDLNHANKMVRVLRKRNKKVRENSSLEVAVFTDNYELAEFLLQNSTAGDFGASMVETNMLLKTIIAELRRGLWLIEFVQLLIEYKALDVDKTKENGNGPTPLDVAIVHSSWDVVKLLLENGVNVNYIQKIGGMSPLMEAIFDKRGCEPMAYLLIDNGADVTYETTKFDMTVLDACVYTERLDLMRRVIVQNPRDTESFKRALCIAYTKSGVSKSEINEVMPKSLKNRNMSPSVPILLGALGYGPEHRTTFRG
jgi:hypothetical protein